MKRLVPIVLVLLLLTGCTQSRSDITPDEIIEAYEAAGYSVFSGTYEETLEHGQTGYIRADHPNGDYIYFTIFENESAAIAFKEELYHPGAIGLFSAIFGDPSWLRCEVYGNILIEYDNPEYYEIFQELLKSK